MVRFISERQMKECLGPLESNPTLRLDTPVFSWSRITWHQHTDIFVFGITTIDIFQTSMLICHWWSCPPDCVTIKSQQWWSCLFPGRLDCVTIKWQLWSYLGAREVLTYPPRLSNRPCKSCLITIKIISQTILSRNFIKWIQKSCLNRSGTLVNVVPI